MDPLAEALRHERLLREARELLDRLIARGCDPRLDPKGVIGLGGPSRPAERQWISSHRDAFRGALVGAGRYTPGTLDAIYGIEQEVEGASPDLAKNGDNGDSKVTGMEERPSRRAAQDAGRA